MLIKSVAVCVNQDIHNSVELAAAAGRECILKSGIKQEDIDLLINIGVFRKDNIVEPALATIIQKKIGLNPDPVPDGKVTHMTFSFDLMKGRCGFLYAAQVAQALMNNKKIKNALIVSSDAHPSGEYHPEFPYTHAGAAALLSKTEKGRGFQKFSFNSTTDSYNGAVVYVANDEGIKARKAITVEEDKDYISRTREYALMTTRKYVQSESVNLKDVKFLITSHNEKNWEKDLSKSLGINDYKKSVNIYEKYGDTYTSALIFDFFHTIQNEKLNRKDKVLFVAAGAGLSSACCLYVV